MKIAKNFISLLESITTASCFSFLNLIRTKIKLEEANDFLCRKLQGLVPLGLKARKFLWNFMIGPNKR